MDEVQHLMLSTNGLPGTESSSVSFCSRFLHRVQRPCILSVITNSMKKTLVWPVIIVAVLFVTVIGLYLTQSPSALFEDTDNGVSFEYPSDWETREYESLVFFAANFDYMDGLAESSASTEAEGTLVYSVAPDVTADSVEDLQEVYDGIYAECVANLEETDQELGPFCQRTDLSGWSKITVDGYTAVVSEWEGAPESGELGKKVIVLVDDQDLVVYVSAIKTGVTDAAIIDAAFNHVLETLKIE